MEEKDIVKEAERYAAIKGHHSYNDRYYGFLAGAGFVLEKIEKPKHMENTMVDVYKLETLENAEVPQEEKYPSGEKFPLKTGTLINIPVVGDNVMVANYSPALGRYFRTSPVVKISIFTEDLIEFTTLNSTYRIVPAGTVMEGEDE